MYSITSDNRRLNSIYLLFKSLHFTTPSNSKNFATLQVGTNRVLTT